MYRIRIFFMCLSYVIFGLVDNAIATTRTVRTRDASTKKATNAKKSGGLFSRAASGTTTVERYTVADDDAYLVVRECDVGYYATGAKVVNGKTYYSECVKCPTYMAFFDGVVQYDLAAMTPEKWQYDYDKIGIETCFIKYKDYTSEKDIYFIDDTGLYDYTDDCYMEQGL